jgi:hypothetical protein
LAKINEAIVGRVGKGGRMVALRLILDEAKSASRVQQATVKSFLRRNPRHLNSAPPTTPTLQISMDITMSDGGASSSRQGQVQVHFITNSPDIELPEGKRQLLVPTSEQNSKSHENQV